MISTGVFNIRQYKTSHGNEIIFLQLSVHKFLPGINLTKKCEGNKLQKLKEWMRGII